MSKSSETRSLLTRICEYPRHLRNYVVWKTGFCRKLRKYDPIFVYQMGKVGSQSIQNELERTCKGAVIHCHRFDEMYHHGKVQELWKYWQEPGPKPAMHIISPFRNPVDRNVSAFFHNFEEYVGVAPADCRLSLEEIKAAFLANFPHDNPLDWYDCHIRDFFGIDVFSRPFPERGWDIFELGTLRLLVLRLEIPADELAQAIRGYLDVPDFRPRRDNLAKEKPYADLYQRFKDEVSLPEEYLDKMLHSRFFTHFYTDADAQATREKWG